MDQDKKTKKSKKKPTNTIDLSKRLYLRMPKKIKEAFEIQDMHPLICNVVLPRQNSRFCFIEFESAEDAEKALKDLSKKGKELKMVIRHATKKEKDDVKNIK